MSELKKYTLDIDVPSEAIYVIDQLVFSGYEAYLVGGCVRDSLLGRTPHDWDVCTNATPEEMQEVFKYEDVIETGLQHGTLTVMIDGMPIEVTTYRADGDYSDHRHPNSVTFVSSLENDLARRDFTINAMAYDCQSHEVLDFYNGMKDIEEKVVRCVGSPDDRFNEDALRMIRAIRFSIVLSTNNTEWAISDDIINSIDKNSALLQYISKERIEEELTKMLSAQNVTNYFRIYPLLKLFGATVVPELRLYQKNETILQSTWLNTICKLNAVKQQSNLITRLCILFPFSSDTQIDILKRLKFSNDVIKGVSNTTEVFETLTYSRTLILDGYISANEYMIKKALSVYGKDAVQNAINLCAAYKGAGTKYNEFFSPESYQCAYNIILDTGECFNLKMLDISGDDVMKCGFTGKDIGRVLNLLLDRVMLKEVSNKNSALIRATECLYSEYRNNETNQGDINGN